MPEGRQGELKAPLHLGTPDDAESAESEPETAIVPVSLELTELLQNPEAYEDQWVEFSATCVKVNPGIMGRNWVHLKALGDAEGEVVLTTQEEIPVGKAVRVKGLVRRNRDFGSGYRYDLLIEEGQRIR